ncbi:MAG: thioredoxin, partial [Acidobacteria bacterium]|nr:thioredoxin [Acidobacteriota bacterium]
MTGTGWKNAAILLLAAILCAGAVPRREAGDDLIGTVAPPFDLEHWLNSDPLEIAALRGKVVLVRWWTDTCPFCAATAPVLRELDRSYR